MPNPFTMAAMAVKNQKLERRLEQFRRMLETKEQECVFLQETLSESQRVVRELREGLK